MGQIPQICLIFNMFQTTIPYTDLQATLRPGAWIHWPRERTTLRTTRTTMRTALTSQTLKAFSHSRLTMRNIIIQGRNCIANPYIHRFRRGCNPFLEKPLKTLRWYDKHFAKGIAIRFFRMRCMKIQIIYRHTNYLGRICESLHHLSNAHLASRNLTL